MRISSLLLAITISLSAASVLAQQASPPPEVGPAKTATGDGSGLAGRWTYRSFHNNPAPVAEDPKTAPEKALALIFAEAVFTFDIPSSTTLKGAIDWLGGGLDLQGIIRPGAAGAGPTVEIVGTGRPGTAPPAGNTTTEVTWPTSGQTASTKFLRWSAR